MDIVDQIKGAAAGREAKIGKAIDQVGDLIDAKTGGQYAAQVDRAQGFLKDQLGGISR